MSEENKIKNMIYEIRGKQVMLDSDLAKLYQCVNGTKTINLAVKSHINRFPDRFMFQLTRDEYYQVLRFQNETLELEQVQYNKYLPFVFTEQGVAMLATILRTKVAEEISVKIMDAFVERRHYISNDLIYRDQINYKLLDHDKRISLLEDTFSGFKEKINHIFFEGKIYDSYSLLLDIFSLSDEEIIIIDNFANKDILDVLSQLNKKIILISKNMDNNLILKYQTQYNNLKILYNDSFHDRFIILDRNTLYHCGASFKDLGKKCFSINKIEDNKVLSLLLNSINFIDL